MISISGPPDHRGVETHGTQRYYYNVSDEEEMDKFFDEIGGALACAIGPLDPAPAQPSRMRVFTKGADGRERALVNVHLTAPAAIVGDLWDDDLPYRTQDYFLYDPEDRMIYVTPPVCDRIQQQHEPVVIRFASTQIVL